MKKCVLSFASIIIFSVLAADIYLNQLCWISLLIAGPAAAASAPGKFHVRDYGVSFSRATLMVALNAIGTSRAILVLDDGLWHIGGADQDVTIPPQVTLEFAPGAVMQIDKGKKLLIRGPLKAGLRQIFSGEGDIHFGPGAASEVFCQWWGALGDGTQDDAPGLQKAVQSITSGVIIMKNPAKKWTINQQVNLTSNKKLVCAGTVGTSINAPQALPVHFFFLEGSNIEIDGLHLMLPAHPFLPDKTSKGRGIGLGDAKNILIQNCKIYYTFYGISSFGPYNLNNVVIEHCELTGIAFDIYFTKCKGSNITIRNNRFLVGRTWAQPRASGGAVCMAAGHYYEIEGARDLVTDHIYEHEYFDQVKITQNYFFHNDGFPINIKNCRNVEIAGNMMDNKLGDRDDVETSNDCIVVQLCRNFIIKDNLVNGSGEGGIDILSSRDGLVAGNILRKIRSAGIYLDVTTAYVLGRAPALNKSYLLTQNIVIERNEIEAMFWVVILVTAKNIAFKNNTFQYYVARDDYPNGLMNYVQLIIQSSYKHPASPLPGHLVSGPAFYGNDSKLFIKNIKFSSSRVLDPTPVPFTIDPATSICTSAKPHGLASGYPVHVRSKNQTVRLPRPLDSQDTYFVVKVSPTQFKLAASFADAKSRHGLSLNNQGADLYLVTSRHYTIKFTKVSFPYLKISSDQFVDTASVELDAGIQPPVSATQ